jgi:hypothetical protein
VTTVPGTASRPTSDQAEQAEGPQQAEQASQGEQAVRPWPTSLGRRIVGTTALAPRLRRTVSTQEPIVTVTETTRTSRRPPHGARRFGYLLGAAINVLLLWFVTVQPGWRWVPFLTEDFVEVVGLVIFSLIVGATVNLVYLAADPRWLKYLGDAVTAAIACVILARMWAIFPIDLGERWGGWETTARVLIALACLGTGIAVVANLAQAARTLTEREGPSGLP